MKKMFFACCAVFILAAFSTNSNNAYDGRPLSAYLLGSNEVPVLGDPDGEGWAELRLNQGQGTIGYMIHVTGIAPATAAHIHRGAAGMPGPVVVALTAPSGGMSSGVATADKDLIKDIRQNPGNYYINIHNAAYPGGALRGQLYK